MDKLIKIDDEEMKQLGERINYNEFRYDGKIYKMFKTHQTESYSYYTVIE